MIILEPKERKNHSLIIFYNWNEIKSDFFCKKILWKLIYNFDHIFRKKRNNCHLKSNFMIFGLMYFTNID